MEKSSIRVIGYIDGFNLYFGLRTKYNRRLLWLNLQKLMVNLLQNGQQLICTKYFTSKISSPFDKRRRQETYIEALKTLDLFKIYYGHYQYHESRCKECGHIHTSSQEKMTDVNIAVELMKDAFQNRFDTAILLSADSDLVPPIQSILMLFPKKGLLSLSRPLVLLKP